MKQKNIDHLAWTYDRLKHVHNENENFDYMRELKRIIDEAGKEGEFTKRHIEIAFCIGMMNQTDFSVDKLSKQLETAQRKIDNLVEDIRKGRFDPVQE